MGGDTLCADECVLELASVVVPSRSIALPNNSQLLTYASPPWAISLRKELFYPGESLDDRTLTLVYEQVINDVLKTQNNFRIRKYERDVLWEMFGG